MVITNLPFEGNHWSLQIGKIHQIGIGIDLIAKDNCRLTALMTAREKGNKDVVKLFLEHSDPNAKGFDFIYGCFRSRTKM